MIIFGIPDYKDWTEHFYKIQNSKIVNIKVNKNVYLDKNNIIIPTSYSDMKNISKCDAFVFSPSSINVETLNNKQLFISFIEKNNLLKYIPDVYFNVNKKIIDFIYPCIYKLNIVSGASNSRILLSENDLKRIKLDRNCIIQKYIKSNIEYSGYFIVKDGEIKFDIYYKETKNTDLFIINGKHMKYEKINMSEYNIYFNEIFKCLNYTGFACADFRLENEKLKIFEINPRFGGTLVHNQIDFQLTIDELYKLKI